jgi:hypothetical protein
VATVAKQLKMAPAITAIAVHAAGDKGLWSVLFFAGVFGLDEFGIVHCSKLVISRLFSAPWYTSLYRLRLAHLIRTEWLDGSGLDFDLNKASWRTNR